MHFLINSLLLAGAPHLVVIYTNRGFSLLYPPDPSSPSGPMKRGVSITCSVSPAAQSPNLRLRGEQSDPQWGSYSTCFSCFVISTMPSRLERISGEYPEPSGSLISFSSQKLGRSSLEKEETLNRKRRRGTMDLIMLQQL